MNPYLKQELKNATIAILIPFVVFGLIFALAGIFSFLSEKDAEPPTPIRIESPDSKLMMVAMRCHTLEQEVDMLRLRIEELEESQGVTNEEYSPPCSQYYLYQSETTNKTEETKVYNPLAVDDLVPLTNE